MHVSQACERVSLWEKDLHGLRLKRFTKVRCVTTRETNLPQWEKPQRLWGSLNAQPHRNHKPPPGNIVAYTHPQLN